MGKMTDPVRQIVGLENFLRKARRRLKESEREEGGSNGPRASRYSLIVQRLVDEIHSVDRKHLQDYLEYVEEDLLPRIRDRVEKTKSEMVEAAHRMVDGKAYLHELRGEVTDALERSRSVRERLGLEAIRPVDAHFGIAAHPPNAERRVRDAHDLARDFLRS